MAMPAEQTRAWPESQAGNEPPRRFSYFAGGETERRIVKLAVYFGIGVFVGSVAIHLWSSIQNSEVAAVVHQIINAAAAD